MNKHLQKILVMPYLLWMTAFILIPLIIVAIYGFHDGSGHFTTANIIAIADPVNRKALFLSIRLSILCTLICLGLAYPLAMILQSLQMKSSSFTVFLFILPMWMNFLLRTTAWQTLLEKNGVINNILSVLHLPACNIINTEAAIVLGMVYNYLPFMILPIYNVLIKIDKETVLAARDLGADGFQAFAKITLPLSMPGIVSGITMVFVPALTTFVISDLLGGGKIQLIGNVIEQEFLTANNWNAGSGLSMVLMIFILISMAFMNKYDKNGEGASLW